MQHCTAMHDFSLVARNQCSEPHDPGGLLSLPVRATPEEHGSRRHPAAMPTAVACVDHTLGPLAAHPPPLCACSARLPLLFLRNISMPDSSPHPPLSLSSPNLPPQPHHRQQVLRLPALRLHPPHLDVLPVSALLYRSGEEPTAQCRAAQGSVHGMGLLRCFVPLAWLV